MAYIHVLCKAQLCLGIVGLHHRPMHPMPMDSPTLTWPQNRWNVHFAFKSSTAVNSQRLIGFERICSPERCRVETCKLWLIVCYCREVESLESSYLMVNRFYYKHEARINTKAMSESSCSPSNNEALERYKGKQRRNTSERYESLVKRMYLPLPSQS